MRRKWVVVVVVLVRFSLGGYEMKKKPGNMKMIFPNFTSFGCTVRVYQAYNAAIADAALAAQHFVPPWQEGRMTWIKPSATWMGYRSGWGQKDRNQCRILAVNFPTLPPSLLPIRETPCSVHVAVEFAFCCVIVGIERCTSGHLLRALYP